MPSYKPRKLTGKRRKAFLRHLAETGHVGRSCEAVGVTAACAYDERKRDPEFAAQWEAAWELTSEKLLSEAHKRAIAGSDRLLEFLLDRLKFKKDGDGSGGGVVINILRFGDGDRSLLAQGTQPVITVQPEGLEEPAPINVRRVPVGKEEDDASE